MKNVLGVLVSVFFLSLSIQSFGQKPLEYETVLYFDSSYTKNVLYDKLHEWVVNNYVSGNNVIQLSDKDGGIIIVKGLYVYSGCGTYDKAYHGHINHTLTIRIKDYRCKISIANFEHNSWQNGAYQTSLGIVYDAPTKVKGMNAKWAMKRIRPDIEIKMKNKSETTFKSIEVFVNW